MKPAALPAIDHCQLAMEEGKEEMARAFYAVVLGMEEVAKPPVWADRGSLVRLRERAVALGSGKRLPSGKEDASGAALR